MNANLRYAVLISSAHCFAAFAQSTETGGQEETTVNQPVHKATAPPVCVPAQGQQSSNEAKGEPFFATKQAVTEWRGPRLVGVPVYSADN